MHPSTESQAAGRLRHIARIVKRARRDLQKGPTENRPAEFVLNQDVLGPHRRFPFFDRLVFGMPSNPQRIVAFHTQREELIERCGPEDSSGTDGGSRDEIVAGSLWIPGYSYVALRNGRSVRPPMKEPSWTEKKITI